jgi:hypothetical protein
MGTGGKDLTGLQVRGRISLPERGISFAPARYQRIASSEKYRNLPSSAETTGESAVN